MNNIIYITRNLINGKTYIGQHSTFDINDGYLGSGKFLKLAIKKYGKENFKMTVLRNYKSKSLMNYVESVVVDANYIASNDNYNACVGGTGGDKLSPKTKEERIKIKQKVKNTYNKRTKEARDLTKKKTQQTYDNKTQKEMDQISINKSLGHLNMSLEAKTKMNKLRTKRHYEKSQQERDSITEKRMNTIRNNPEIERSRRENISKSWLKKPLIEKIKHAQKISDALKGKRKRAQPQVTCLGCRKVFRMSGYTLHHGIKCKSANL